MPRSTVATVEVIQAPQTINRVNPSRAVSVTGDTISGNVTAMTASIREILDGYTLPEGYTVEISGSYADMQENYSDLLLALYEAGGEAALFPES